MNKALLLLFGICFVTGWRNAIAEAPKRDLEVLVVVGAGGADEYEGRFHREAEVWKGTCQKAGVNCSIIGAAESSKNQTDAAALKAWIEKFAAEKRGSLWMVLIGHGSWSWRLGRPREAGREA